MLLVHLSCQQPPHTQHVVRFLHISHQVETHTFRIMPLREANCDVACSQKPLGFHRSYSSSDSPAFLLLWVLPSLLNCPWIHSSNRGGQRAVVYAGCVQALRLVQQPGPGWHPVWAGLKSRARLRHSSDRSQLKSGSLVWTSPTVSVCFGAWQPLSILCIHLSKSIGVSRMVFKCNVVHLTQSLGDQEKLAQMKKEGQCRFCTIVCAD